MSGMREQDPEEKTCLNELEAEAAEEALKHGKIIEQLRYWFSGERLEMQAVGLCFLTLIGGWLLGKYEYGLLSVVCYVVAYLTGGWFGTLAAWESIRERRVDIDLLMILAAVGALVVGAPFEGAMLLFLFSFSNVLQGFAMGKTRNAIRSLARMRPKQARVLRNGEPVLVDIGEVCVGDSILIRPGDMIPLDSTVIQGESSVDQSSLTGESIPCYKHTGDLIFAGSINLQGSLTAHVDKPEKDSTLARMMQMVESAQSEKAQTQRFLEAYEEKYALGVIMLTVVLMGALPFIMGIGFSEAFYRAITVMVVASPCALVISTPASILSGIANGAHRGILFKGGAHLERAGTAVSVAFDKTGTLTEGKPQLLDLIPVGNSSLTENEVLQLAASIEGKSEHPLAQAIVSAAKGRGLSLRPVESFHSHTGKGLEGKIEGLAVWVGSPQWVSTVLNVSLESYAAQITALESDGKTVICLVRALGQTKSLCGILALADRVRSESAAVVQKLKDLHFKHILMLTGDSKPVAAAIASRIGMHEYFASLLPEDKVTLIKEFGQKGPIVMVGDGTNDAPALAVATVGIAMGAAGSDVALESADIVLMSSDLSNVPYALALSRQVRRVMAQNLIFAGGVIVVMVIATLALPIWGLSVPLPLGVLAHEGGTVLVCLNGLRLLFFKG
jgi:Cd2+/Zn2+-exporting ATPase